MLNPQHRYCGILLCSRWGRWPVSPAAAEDSAHERCPRSEGTRQHSCQLCLFPGRHHRGATQGNCARNRADRARHLQQLFVCGQAGSADSSCNRQIRNSRAARRPPAHRPRPNRSDHRDYHQPRAVASTRNAEVIPGGFSTRGLPTAFWERMKSLIDCQGW